MENLDSVTQNTYESVHRGLLDMLREVDLQLKPAGGYIWKNITLGQCDLEANSK